MHGKKKGWAATIMLVLAGLSFMLTGCEFVEDFFADGEIYKIKWNHSGKNYTAKQAEDFLISRGLFCGQTYDAYGSVNGEKARVHRVKFSKKSAALPDAVSASKSDGNVNVSAEMKFKEDTYEVMLDDEAYQWNDKVCTGVGNCTYSVDVSTKTTVPWFLCEISAKYSPLSDMVTNIRIIIKKSIDPNDRPSNDGSYWSVMEDWRPGVMSYDKFLTQARALIRRETYDVYKGQNLLATDAEWSNKSPYSIIDFKGQGDALVDCIQKENTGGMSDVGAGFYLPAKIQLKIKDR